MTKSDFERLYAFNRWANARTLGAAEALTMLRQLGAAAVGTDLSTFSRETSPA